MPVIAGNKNLVGLLTWTDIEKIINNPEKQRDSVSDIMKTKLHTITQYKSIEAAKEKMKKYNINCLPVVKKKQLLGIITTSDF